LKKNFFEKIFSIQKKVIDNVPRGNLLARFLKNPPKPPSPPPKKEFKWALPTTSKATESTYWKPPPKPQPYKSSGKIKGI